MCIALSEVSLPHKLCSTNIIVSRNCISCRSTVICICIGISVRVSLYDMMLDPDSSSSCFFLLYSVAFFGYLVNADTEYKEGTLNV